MSTASPKPLRRSRGRQPRTHPPVGAGGQGTTYPKAGNMSISSPTIPPDVAAHVLFHYGREGGYQAGSFTTALLSAMGTADPSNLDRLAAGFPEYVAAVAAIQYDPDGVERLQDLAAGRCPRCKKDDGPNTPTGLCEPCAQPMPLDGAA